MNELEKTKVQEIISLHNEIIAYLKMSLPKAIRIGELLIQQKAILKHGDWLPWIKKNLPFSRQTADNYRHCYQHQEKLLSVGNLKFAYKVLMIANREEIRKEALLSLGEPRTLAGIPEDYYEREKVVLTKKEPDAFLVCLALGPNRDHPYIETADFKIDDMNRNVFEGMTREELFSHVLDLHEAGIACCLKTGTWGNFFNPKMEIGCKTHFINYSSVNKPQWFQSGLEHGLPENAFKTDISFIEVDPRSEEEKVIQLIEVYNRDIEKHQKEIEKLQKKIAKLNQIT